MFLVSETYVRHLVATERMLGKSLKREPAMLLLMISTACPVRPVLEKFSHFKLARLGNEYKTLHRLFTVVYFWN